MPGCVKMVHTGSTTLDYSHTYLRFLILSFYMSRYLCIQIHSLRTFLLSSMFIFMIFDKLFFVCTVLFFQIKVIGTKLCCSERSKTVFFSRRVSSLIYHKADQ